MSCHVRLGREIGSRHITTVIQLRWTNRLDMSPVNAPEIIDVILESLAPPQAGN